MRVRSKEQLFACFLALSDAAASAKTRAEYKADPVSRDEALASATTALTKLIEEAMYDAACLIMVRGGGDCTDKNDQGARRVFDLLSQAQEAVMEEAVTSRSPPRRTVRRRKSAK